MQCKSLWIKASAKRINVNKCKCKHGVFHRDQKTSLISLLLKKGKDPLDCSSYRPISLIPCDVKIYVKVFASHMEKVIHSLIKEDQTGFIKGRNASDNMRRLLIFLTLQTPTQPLVRSFHLMQKKPLTGKSGIICGQFCNVSASVNTSFLWLRHYTTHLQHQS